MRESPGRIALVAALAATSLVMASTALATSSSISIAAHNSAGPNGRFNGTVKSSDSGCAKHAEVKVYRDAPGGGRHFKVGARATTDRHGKWIAGFKGRIPKGTYYAKSGGGSCPAVTTSKLKIA